MILGETEKLLQDNAAKIAENFTNGIEKSDFLQKTFQAVEGFKKKNQVRTQNRCQNRRIWQTITMFTRQERNIKRLSSENENLWSLPSTTKQEQLKTVAEIQKKETDKASRVHGVHTEFIKFGTG